VKNMDVSAPNERPPVDAGTTLQFVIGHQLAPAPLRPSVGVAV
jgi:hypothetical protein